MKKNSNTMLYVGVVLLFVFAFIILIGKQEENKAFADINENNITLRTIEGKQLVVKDLNSIYPKYFVIYFDSTDKTYITHVFNYYQTDSQYEMGYNSQLESIIDYNYNDYMIRCIYNNGIGTYDDVLEELPFIIGSSNYKII